MRERRLAAGYWLLASGNWHPANPDSVCLPAARSHESYFRKIYKSPPIFGNSVP